jgi:MFS transporter, ACS family, tartrate transporter
MNPSLPSRVTRKLLWRLGPIILLLYLFFAVDRGNIGFAGAQIRSAIGISAETFGIGSALFTAAFLLFQIPSAEWLRKLGGGTAFALVGCSWGVISAATAFVGGPVSFFANRFLLGAAEAGVTAFIVAYISAIFPRSVQGAAVGLILLAVPLAMIASSPLSGVLLNVTAGGLQGWQTMFLAEGIPSVILGLLCMFLVPKRVQDIRFLSVEERQWLEQQLASRTGPGAQLSGPRATAAALASLNVWCLGFVLFANIFAVNVMLVWMPQMIRQFVQGNVLVGWLNTLPWVALGSGLFIISRLSDRLPSRFGALIPAMITAMTGFMIAAFVQQHPSLSLLFFCLGAFGTGAAQGVFWPLVAEILPPAYRATAFAVIGVIGNGSGLFAHPLIGRLLDLNGSFATVTWALAGFNLAAAIVALFIIRGRPDEKQRAEASPISRELHP